MPLPLDAKAIGESLPDSAFRFVEWEGNYAVYEAWLDNEGKTRIRKKVLVGDEELQEWNRHRYDTSGRFSQREVGALGVPVANIPMSVFFSPNSGIAEHIRKGDRDHLTWFLNRPENLHYRTQKGKL